MQEKIIKSFDSTNIYYKLKQGKTGKPVLLFIHGLSGNHTVWKRSLTYFSKKNYTVLAVDLHGHGYSYKCRKAHRYSIKHFARDLKAIIDHEHLKNVVLVGISLGGMVILTYEQMFGKGTEKLVLMGTTPRNPLRYSPFPFLHFLTPLYVFFAYIVAYISSKIPSRKWPYLDYSFFKHHNALTIVYYDLKVSPLYSYFWSVMSMFFYDMKEHLHKIKKPTLLLVGGKDFVVTKKASYELATYLLHSKVHVIPEADHLIPLRYPDEMNKIIEVFVNDKKRKFPITKESCEFDQQRHCSR
ncbi:alpha/beta hydrolase [Candidatus Woesearchaeota archaeon]|nr:alpha/beta hydrolase [Candidatus Woesearchaeota archaeon]